MADERNNFPELTLTPNSEAAAQAVPELTLAPTAAQAPQEPAKPAAPPVNMMNLCFLRQRKKAVEEFSRKIDITDSNMVLQYGAAAQKNVAGFSEKRPSLPCAPRTWVKWENLFLIWW